MERAAEEKIVASYNLTNNTITGQLVVFRNPASDSEKARFTFDLNGQRHTVDAERSVFDGDRTDLLVELGDKIAKRIAAEVIGDSLRKLRW